MSEIDLSRVWAEIIKESGVSGDRVAVARDQLLTHGDVDTQYSFQQADTVAKEGGLASVIEWIEATDMLPEEKLQRAKYLVNKVRYPESLKAADTISSKVFIRIIEALSQLGQERNQ